ALVRLAERRLELGEDFLRFGPIRIEEPLEGVECELFDSDDRKRTRVFAGSVPAHAVRDEKQVAALATELRFRLGQARLPDAHRLGELGAEELILVGRADAALVGDSECLHRKRAMYRRRVG